MSTLFSGHYLRNRSTLDIGVLGYIGIVEHKEHSPEVLSLPPGTSLYKLVFIRYMVHILGGLSSISIAGCQCVLSVFEAKFRGSTLNYVTTFSRASWFMNYSTRCCVPYKVLSNDLTQYILTMKYHFHCWLYIKFSG